MRKKRRDKVHAEVEGYMTRQQARVAKRLNQRERRERMMRAAEDKLKRKFGENRI
jgi:hypothetical protein